VTGDFVLDWAVMAVSLFNTVLLLWLGLTVLLNAERRAWGIWLAGGGLLMAGAFFVSHSAILGHDLHQSTLALDFWWWVGWLPVVAAPYAWYALMLWYAGFWDDKEAPLRRRHRVWLPIVSLPAFVFAGLLLFANPLPSYWQVTQLELSASPAVGDLPLLILLYPFYNVFCIVLSLDVLRRPGPSGRVMGDLARRRARPWLVATATTLLLVSFLVAWAMFWILSNARQRAFYQVYSAMARTLAWFDLVIAALIALAVILLGQAIVAYEVFTGKTLPRRGLSRHWRRAVILAAGYGLVVGLSLTVRLRPIYSLLLTAILMTFFYALLSWRSYAERERTIEGLRPFVASQRLYDQLLAPSPSFNPDLDGNRLLGALCGDLLGAQLAFLLPQGALAPLINAPFTFPVGADPPPPLPADTLERIDSPQQICLPVEPTRHGGAIWAVPLWSERGLIGVLLLGPKRDNGLYSQEEIEIARSSGERLMDSVAGSELAGRLMALQRQRLAASQVIDRQARRMLHDDVLPQLHAAMLTLAPVGESAGEAVAQLADVHRQLSDLLREMPATAAPELARQGLVGALRQVLERELPDAFDGVSWEIDVGAADDLADIPPLTAEVLFYAAREAIRNAARHGRDRVEASPLHLRLEIRAAEGVEILVEDDGRGMGETSPSPEAGRGLALHSTMMAVIGGALAIESRPGAFTRVRLRLPGEAIRSVDPQLEQKGDS
jgi:signal transduction histidine kinase